MLHSSFLSLLRLTTTGHEYQGWTALVSWQSSDTVRQGAQDDVEISDKWCDTDRVNNVHLPAAEPAGDFTALILRIGSDAIVVAFRAAQAWSQIPWFLRMDLARMTEPGAQIHLPKLPDQQSQMGCALRLHLPVEI